MGLFTCTRSTPSRAMQPQSKLGVDEKDTARTSTSSSTASESDNPPAYSEAVGSHTASSSSAPPGSFAATSQLQIDAIGYTMNQALTDNTLEDIPVSRVGSGELEYISLRQKKSSNSCALVRGSDSSRTPLIATIYRWGPGRRPRMRIFPPNTSASVDNAINSEDVDAESIDIKSRSMLSRAQEMVTPFGTFTWRYAGSAERKEAHGADSLLVMERTDLAPSAGGKSSKNGVRVAQLVRNDELRTAGTARYQGGNGGRLMIDLGMWTNDKGASAKDIEAFVVAGCICMLKREADRFRDNTIAAVV